MFLIVFIRFGVNFLIFWQTKIKKTDEKIFAQNIEPQPYCYMKQFVQSIADATEDKFVNKPIICVFDTCREICEKKPPPPEISDKINSNCFTVIVYTAKKNTVAKGLKSPKSTTNFSNAFQHTMLSLHKERTLHKTELHDLFNHITANLQLKVQSHEIETNFDENIKIYFAP